MACGIDYWQLSTSPLAFINQLTDMLILAMHRVNIYFPKLMLTPWTLLLLISLYYRKSILVIILSLGLSHMTHIDQEKPFWKNKRLKIKNPPNGGFNKNKFL
jgi:hypothetical protein